jgi:hypothetical protein
VADELQAAYNDLDYKWRSNKGRFVDMMVMDGCFLLEWARTWLLPVAVDYATNDPVFSVRSYIKLWPTIRRDMIAMENQLPLLVLQRLLAIYEGGKFPVRTFLGGLCIQNPCTISMRHTTTSKKKLLEMLFFLLDVVLSINV